MTEKEVVRRLNMAVAAAGGVRPLARQWQVSPAWISQVRNRRRPPSKRILAALGLVRERIERTIIYAEVA